MLNTDNKNKLAKYLDETFTALEKDVKNIEINKRISCQEPIKKVMEITVNTLTPKSKMILASTYKMLESNTFEDEYFKNSKNKARFYESNILSKLQDKFNFDIPQEIKYDENKKTIINKMIATGAILVVGGIVSISIKNFLFPMGMATIMIAIMAYVLKDSGKGYVFKESNEIDEIFDRDIKKIIDKYLGSVKQSLWAWLESINEYYDEKVEELKRG